MRARSEKSVVVVTDSTVYAAPGLLDERTVIVPLRVLINTPDGESASLWDGELSPEQLVDKLDSCEVTTSAVTPERFAEVYRRLADKGAQEIVSVHLSSRLSSTCAAASVAASTAPIPVHVLDTRSVGMGIGFAVQTLWNELDRGHDVATALRVAKDVCASESMFFVVDSLTHLLRGGRISTAAANVGRILRYRPILTVKDGVLDVEEKVRTMSKASDRLADLVSEVHRERGASRIAVHHLNAFEGATHVAEKIADLTKIDLVDIPICPVGAVIGAHTGPGLIAAVIAR